MRLVKFSALGGGIVAINPEMVTSVHPRIEGVDIYVCDSNGAVEVVEEFDAVIAALTAADEPEAKARRLVRLEENSGSVCYVDPADVLNLYVAGEGDETSICSRIGADIVVVGHPDKVARALGLVEVP